MSYSIPGYSEERADSPAEESGARVSGSWGGYRTGDWVHLTSNERGEYRLNGEPIDRESVRRVFGFCPSFGLARNQPTIRVVSVNDGIVTVEG